jgi:membrane-bound lytic murein transglycosylase D
MITVCWGVSAFASAPIDVWPGIEQAGPLQANVAFWTRIYGELDSDFGMVHDAKYPQVVYETLDLRRKKRRGSAIAQAERKWRQVLLSVHQKWNQPGGVRDDQLTPDEKKAVELFKDVPHPDKFLDAAHRRRIRFQLGQKNSFLAGYRISGRYLPAMEEIFRQHGLPIQLARLPFVESSFNVKARSKVGASGIWQFMRSTGSLYLRIDETVDERNDPIRAAEAAAQLLKRNFQELGSWPLAVTAYNHGRKGMMRAVRKVGSVDLSDVITDYQRRSFGFASSNFYTCLLAVIEVEKRAEQYLGPVERDRPVPSFEFELPKYVDLPELVSFFKLDSRKLKELNPALAPSVWEGVWPAPRGYRIRLPHEESIPADSAFRLFSAGYEKFPPLYQFDEPQKRNSRKLKKYGKRLRS